ncbi:MAG: hypothetical protein PHS62_05445 [Patescibacteria group bacterium]|nr:hypothetical protein [Patescibacteria group bacterium]
MSTIHKCDKCGKAIKGNEISISFVDINRRLFEGSSYNSFDFCEECAKPLVVYVKGFVKFNKKFKK